MKALICRLFAISLIMTVSVSHADDPFTGSPFSDNLKDIREYIYNLGQYLGFDLCNFPGGSANPNCKDSPAPGVSQNLLNLNATQLTQNYLFNTSLGAIPVNTAGSPLFVPTGSTLALINSFANFIFSNAPYSSPSASQVSVTPLIDQQNYQADPVSQAVLNLLTTPDFSYCLNNDGTALLPNCKLSYQELIMSKVVGNLPDTQSYFSFNYNQPLLSQLNSNSLLAPLMYTTTDSGANSTSSSPNQTNSTQGLTAQNQAQQAANFIRYATGAVIPPTLPTRSEYDALYTKSLSSNPNVLERTKAQYTLANYLANLRVFAAQSSIGVSNLYYILSKRLPQNLGEGAAAGSSSQTSQALSEFKMATWRLFNPDQSVNTQWITQINQASPATVQKEIATLLAEINYQLYLNRQQEERILLTNSMLLIQNARASQPSGSLSTNNDTTQ